MPSQSRSNGQLGYKGIGAKSLEYDLGDVHTYYCLINYHKYKFSNMQIKQLFSFLYLPM